jgi:hypothetical protein
MVKPFVLAETGNLDVEDDMRKDDFYYHFSKFYQHRPFLGKISFLSLLKEPHCMQDLFKFWHICRSFFLTKHTL